MSELHKELRAAIDAHETTITQAEDALLTRAAELLASADILLGGVWYSAGKVEYWEAYGAIGVRVPGDQLIWLEDIEGVRPAKLEAVEA